MFEKNLMRASIAVGLMLAAGMASAGSLYVQRGYETCIDDLDRDYPRHARLVHASHYYQDESDDALTYFVNSTAWAKGDRVQLKTQCLTDRFGRELVSRETEFGRWVQNRGRVTVDEVAGLTSSASVQA